MLSAAYKMLKDEKKLSLGKIVPSIKKRGN